MKWFKHDTDANMDAKLQEVLLDYGLEGYGLYWYCIELIAGKVGAENLTFSLEHDARIIARNTGGTTQKITEMMTRFVEVGLFEDKDGLVTCMRLAKRLDKSMTSNPDMRAAIEGIRNNHDLVMTQSAKPMQEENRLEENRLEEKRTEESKSKQKESTDNFNEVLLHLKNVTGRSFRESTDLKSRLKDYSVEELKIVIDYKAKEWMGKDMQKYLRPQTLFNKTKFEGYLNDSNQLVPTESMYENKPNQNTKPTIDWNSTDWSDDLR